MISLFEIEKEIKQIEQDIANCKRCDLWRTRNNPVGFRSTRRYRVRRDHRARRRPARDRWR